jgi:glycerophosphoryl diester phosphodiesterase
MIYSVALISAHRGGAPVDGETAADRYRRAIALGVDYVEFDVRRNVDGVCVICHDADIAKQLPSEVMTFDQLLEIAGGKVGLHLDLKETGYEDLVVNRALECSPLDMLVITGDDATVAGVKRKFPQVRTGLSLGQDLEGAPPWVTVPVRLGELFPRRRLKACGADFVAVHKQLASLNVLGYCARFGMPAWVWTVDEEAEMRRFLADPRVTALITDRPELALRLRTK